MRRYKLEIHKILDLDNNNLDLLSELIDKTPIRLKEMKIVVYDKNDNNLIDVWNIQSKENNQEPYNFDKIEIDFKGKYVDFIDTRYYTDKEFKNKTVLAPIRICFDELDFVQINKR